MNRDRPCDRCGAPSSGLAGYGGVTLERVCMRCRAIVIRESVQAITHDAPAIARVIAAAERAERGSAHPTDCICLSCRAERRADRRRSLAGGA